MTKTPHIPDTLPLDGMVNPAVPLSTLASQEAQLLQL